MMPWEDSRWKSIWNEGWRPPPLPPFALALTNNSEVGLREVSAYLNLPTNRDQDMANSTIYHQGYDYYFVDGGRSGRLTLPIFWAMDSHYFVQEWAIPRLAVLFDHGAEVNVLHELRKVTPLYFVMIRLQNLSLAKFLVENGADPNFEADICPILCDCIRKKCWGTSQTNTLRFLLEIGTDPNQYDNKGWTPLIVAIDCGDEETVHTLLEHGADPLLRSRTEGNRKLVWSCDPYYGMSALEVSCAITSSTGLLEKILSYIPAHKYTTENLRRPLRPRSLEFG
jgi:Ankyrin repeats (3 copies)